MFYIPINELHKTKTHRDDSVIKWYSNTNTIINYYLYCIVNVVNMHLNKTSCNTLPANITLFILVLKPNVIIVFKL